MFIRRRLDKVVLPLIALGAFCAVSYRPRFHLNPTMPLEFLDSSAAPVGQKRITEDRIARAYWQCAALGVQWRHGYGAVLPTDPAQEFTLAANAPGSDPATRLRYWRRLRQLWYSPSIWKKDYEWDTSWTFNWVRSAGEWLHMILPSTNGT